MTPVGPSTLLGVRIVHFDLHLAIRVGGYRVQHLEFMRICLY